MFKNLFIQLTTMQKNPNILPMKNAYLKSSTKVRFQRNRIDKKSRRLRAELDCVLSDSIEKSVRGY